MKLPKFLKFIFAFCNVVLFLHSQNALGQELSSVELLQKLIQIDTTNPPGNEIALAQFVQQYLKNFDIDSEILESAPGRANLIARIPGSGEVEPMLLLGHMDVVTADPKEWTYPPFEAHIEGPYLYGRGAIDMKGMMAMEITSFVRLKKEKTPLKGDVLLVLAADEEAGSKFGTQFLIEKHWDKIRCRLVLTEGSIGVVQEGLHLYPIQVAEKGVAWMKLTAHGTSGHGSMPLPDNAVVILVRVLDRLADRKQPIQKTAIVAAFLDRLAQHLPFPKSFVVRHLFTWPIRPTAQWFFSGALQKEKVINALVRNTLVPTILQAGIKTNVIPGEATANLDGRILPGETPEGFKQKVVEWIDDPTIQVELINQSLPSESPFDTPFFKVLEKSILARDPDAIVAPYISPGATDNRFFRAKGILSYGFIPNLIPAGDISGMHGKNERVPVEELAKGVEILSQVIKETQGN